jgi:hypothetical protein
MPAMQVEKRVLKGSSLRGVKCVTTEQARSVWSKMLSIFCLLTNIHVHILYSVYQHAEHQFVSNFQGDSDLMTLGQPCKPSHRKLVGKRRTWLIPESGGTVGIFSFHLHLTLAVAFNPQPAAGARTSNSISADPYLSKLGAYLSESEFPDKSWTVTVLTVRGL